MQTIDKAREPAPCEPVEAARYVGRLATEAREHRAVRHPYLVALREGTLPDTRFALTDFARHYNGYSAHFPRYVTSVISRLERAEHRNALLHNLVEEGGTYRDDDLAVLARAGVDRAWIDGVAHPMLFRRFAEALGVDHGAAPEADQVVCWREMLLAVLSTTSAAEAIGALGLGTENIVHALYGPFVEAIARLGDVHPRDAVFFALHTVVDDDHQATLAAIAVDLAATPEGRAGLRRGMLKALTLRAGFWDWLHARALDPQRADALL